MPNVPPAGEPHTWAVTAQEEEPTIDENGRATTTHHVHFKTNTGIASHVSLDDKDFKPGKVAKAIHDKAHHLNTVHSMNSANAPEHE